MVAFESVGRDKTLFTTDRQPEPLRGLGSLCYKSVKMKQGVTSVEREW